LKAPLFTSLFRGGILMAVQDSVTASVAALLRQIPPMSNLAKEPQAGNFTPAENAVLTVAWPLVRSTQGVADTFSRLLSARNRSSITNKVNSMIKSGELEDYAANANKSNSVLHFFTS
jgi:hypothetical protein